MKRPPETPQFNGADIAQKVAFMRVSFGLFGNTRKVPNYKVTIEGKKAAEDEQPQDKSFLRVSKTLLDSPELDAIRKADGEIRRWLYNMICMQADLGGVYIVSLAAVPVILAKLRDYKDRQRPELVETFIRAYPRLCEESKRKRGEWADDNDYTDAETARDEFSFSWEYLSFSAPEQLKTISRAVYEEEREKAARRLDVAAEEIRALMRSTMAELVTHLKDRLDSEKDGKPKVFKDATVNNLKEFLETFNLRNVTGDRELEAQVEKAKSLLNGVEAKKLRDNDSLRSYVQKEMTKVSDTLGKLVINKPTRKIRADII